jgi:hypothetical protein
VLGIILQVDVALSAYPEQPCRFTGDAVLPPLTVVFDGCLSSSLLQTRIFERLMAQILIRQYGAGTTSYGGDSPRKCVFRGTELTFGGWRHIHVELLPIT